MPNLALNLTAAARRWPDRIATRVDQHTLTYAELDAAAGRLAAFLAAAGIGPGDRVGLMLPNTAAVPVAYYGILRRGAIVVPMNPLMHAREVEFYLTNTGARALFGTPAFADAATAACAAAGTRCWIVDDAELDSLTADLSPVGPPVDRADSDTAVILHTSGTTGRPKGGEEVGAAVVLKPDAQANPDELRRFVKERIAAYKYPRRIWLATSLPKGATGKILRRAVQRPEFPEFQEK